MQQHHALVVEQLMALAEKSIVEADAYMLEHSYRDDAVEFSRNVAIILQTELDLVGQSLFVRAHLRERVLLSGKRDPGDTRAANTREIKRQATPAAADIEHASILGDEKLGRQVTFLGELCVIERLSAVFEIRAAILPVGVQEECIKLLVEIVMVRDVTPRARAQIQLRQAAVEKSRKPWNACPAGGAAVGALTEQDGKDIRDRAPLDDDPAIHVGFAESKLRMSENGALSRPGGETYRHRRPRAV